MFDLVIKLTFVMVFAVSCGPKVQETTDVSMGSFVAKTEFGDLIPIPVGFGNQDGFMLATPVDQFNMTMDGCASGLSYSNITETNPVMNIYKHDQNCKAKLLSFVNNGNTYNPRVGNDFVNYEIGEIALFENIANTLDTIEVRVGSQLGSPLLETDRVAYGSVQIQENTTVHSGILAPSVVSQGVATTTSEVQYAISIVELMGVEGSDNSGVYQISLECRSRLKQKGKNAPHTCFDLNVLGTTYLLIEDTFGGVPCSTADPSGCDALFDGSELTVTAANFIDTNDVDLKNGGFFTAPMSSPANIMIDPDVDMLLILENSGNYQFFRISVALSQTY